MNLLTRQPEIAELFASLRPTHAVTLHPNQREWLREGERPTYAPEAIKRSLFRLADHFHSYTNRRLLGPRWDKRSQDEWTSGIWVAEHLTSGPHLHAIVRAPNDCLNAFDDAASAAWGKLCPGGSVDIQKAYGTRWPAYMLKLQSALDNIGQLQLATDNLHIYPHRFT